MNRPIAFIQPCFIRKNTPELREKLEKLGYSICVCASFKDAVWLDTATHTKPCSSHGIGFWDETYDCEDVEGACRIFLEENKTSVNPKIDCGTNDEMFLALAALRNDTDINQWFIRTEECVSSYTMGLVKAGAWQKNTQYRLLTYSLKRLWRKATSEEIVEHFKDKKP